MVNNNTNYKKKPFVQEDEYKPKVFPKKEKEVNEETEHLLKLVDLEKEKNRQKREMKKKKPKNKKYSKEERWS